MLQEKTANLNLAVHTIRSPYGTSEQARRGGTNCQLWTKNTTSSYRAARLL